MFEYMASGNPIVTTDLPSIREVLDDNSALFVPPDDVGALSEGVLKLLSDENLANTLGANAKLESKKYSWDKRAQKIIDFI
jgi:glycosyltransferase involved in cell wall biosynthesis